jgi:Transglutaminase-like superfamily
LEKARFYFVWVARNIRYDEEMAKTVRLDFDSQTQSPQFVFKSHKAICTGYARLLAYLCKQSHIPAIYVAGYGKEESKVDSIETHAWNVVKIGGEWALFDPTWASNVLGSDSTFLGVPFERYFMGTTDYFQKGHLPYDPVFQLTKEITTRQLFFEHTEGGDSETPDEDFTTILNRDFALDSLNFMIQSHRRGVAFMHGDSNILAKLRGVLKEKQNLMLKSAHEGLLDFSKTAEKNVEKLSQLALNEWSERFQKLAEPLQTALETNREIEQLETKEEKINEAKLSGRQISDLINYFSQSWNRVKNEIEKRK